MCCRKDDKLTAKYRNRKKPIRAWKVYELYDWGPVVLRGQHLDSPGGTVGKPGVVRSDAQGPKCRRHVYYGIHAYLHQKDAANHARKRPRALRVAPVSIEPRHVRAIGPVVWDEAPHGELGWGTEIVATQVRITPRAFREATKP